MNAAALSTEQKLALIWKHTHRDFKGKWVDGTRCILILRPGEGTCSVPLVCLTETEIADKLKYALNREERAKMGISR